MTPVRSLLCLLALVLPLGACVSHVRSPERDPAPLPAPVRTPFSVETVTYTPPHWPQALAADLYQPEGAGPFAGVITIHGGGWDARDRSDMDSVAEKLAARGHVVLNIDYRLAPHFLYPASLEDTREAIRYLRRHAAALRLDPQRIAAWGYSAGAHLAALAATADAGPATRLQAVVAGGLPSDLPYYPHSPIIRRYLGGSHAEKPAAWEEASPARRVTAQTPPMFLYHGTWDRLVYIDDAYTMKSALLAAGVPHELYEVHGAGHIATFLFGFGAEGAGLEFLQRTLR